MALLGNYDNLQKSPGRSLGGVGPSGAPSNWQKPGSVRGRFANDQGPTGTRGIGARSDTPSGYALGEAYVPAITDGDLSARGAILGGSGSITVAVSANWGAGMAGSGAAAGTLTTTTGTGYSRGRVAGGG